MTAGILLTRSAKPGLLVTAAVALVLLLVGIHNAWDTVTYVAVRRIENDTPSTSQEK
jgi:hypothetical protein